MSTRPYEHEHALVIDKVRYLTGRHLRSSLKVASNATANLSYPKSSSLWISTDIVVLAPAMEYKDWKVLSRCS